MNASKFKGTRIILYFLLVSLFLFISGNTGRYLIDTQGMNRQAALLLQGVIFTGLTLIVLYWLKAKNPQLFTFIGLRGMHSRSKLFVGAALPFVLLLSGIFSAALFGGIENISLQLTGGVLLAVFINTITAFLYEAFPEEVFIRGLIFSELRKKYRFIVSLFLQMLLFMGVPTLVMVLAALFFNQPLQLTIDYFVLLFAFGVALQLYREYTGSLWMSIYYHLMYLEIARYISGGGMYDPDVALLAFDEVFGGFMTLYLSFLFMVLLSIAVLTVLLLIDKKRKTTITKKMF